MFVMFLIIFSSCRVQKICCRSYHFKDIKDQKGSMSKILKVYLKFILIRCFLYRCYIYEMSCSFIVGLAISKIWVVQRRQTLKMLFVKFDFNNVFFGFLVPLCEIPFSLNISELFIT
jgi:hypothetical protein